MDERMASNHYNSRDKIMTNTIEATAKDFQQMIRSDDVLNQSPPYEDVDLFGIDSALRANVWPWQGSARSARSSSSSLRFFALLRPTISSIKQRVVPS
jgi:hypothetical protein